MTDVRHLVDHVQLAEQIQFFPVILHGIQSLPMALIDIFDVPKPVVDQAMRLILHGRLHPAAAVVPADDDVLDLQDFHGELQHGETVEIGMHHDVGDVPMDEQLSGKEAHDFIRRNAAVGAADP